MPALGSKTVAETIIVGAGCMEDGNGGAGFGKVFIATSLDGFIARRDGTLDWLTRFDDGDDDHGHGAFMASVDGIVMGRRTYETVLGFDHWPFDKPVVVMSRTLSPTDVPESLRGRVEITAAEPMGLVSSLRDRGWRHAYIDGGQVIRAFLRAGLIGELTITTAPVLIGDGLPLFGVVDRDVSLTLMGCRSYPSGLVGATYRVGAVS